MDSGIQAEECSHCGRPFEPDQSMGLCPNCLLDVAVQQLDPYDHPSLSTMPQTGRCPGIGKLNEQISGLEFIELLGRGGSGWTYLAIQQSLSRQVAVKVLQHRFVETDDSQSRFRQEARSLAKLNHPAIVTVHDFGVTDDFLYLVMEYVAGPTLRHRMHSGALSAAQSLQIIQEICDAAQYAHDQGVLHRDIKPENILFESDDPNSPIKVADFGIAQILSGEKPNYLTATGLVVGTPFYMAPEQSELRTHVEHRSDVYSIGVVAYELLTGRLPLGRFPKPSALCDCSRTVDRAVLGALENQLSQRTPSAFALSRDLQANSQLQALRSPAVLALVAIALGGYGWWAFARPDATKAEGSLNHATAELQSPDEEENPFLAALSKSAQPPIATGEFGENSHQPEGEANQWKPDVGDRVEAKWGAMWFDATVLGEEGEFMYRVHYEGWPASRDDTLPISRLRQRHELD